MPPNPKLHLPTIWAKVAARYLFEDDADPLVWRGLWERGVDYTAVIDRSGPLVLRSVGFYPEGRFTVDGLGEHAYLHAVHSETDPKDVVDIVAWSASQPHRYGTLLNNAGLLGGDAVLNPVSFIECPCPIWATPLAWLRNLLRGCVLLNAELAAPILARAPGKLQCEDETHARWLIESDAVELDKLMESPRKVA